MKIKDNTRFTYDIGGKKKTGIVLSQGDGVVRIQYDGQMLPSLMAWIDFEYCMEREEIVLEK